MATFIDDIGEALETAIRANSASFSGALKSPNGTLACYYDYTEEAGGNLIDNDGVCNIRFVNADTIADRESSAQSVFTYLAKFTLFDVAGAGKAIAVARQGMTNTFANRGRTVLETYFTDNGSNWLGKSGRIEWDFTVTPLDQLADKDHPTAESLIRVVLDHNVPLA